MNKKIFLIKNLEKESRLDQYIAQYLLVDLSREKVQHMLKAQKILVNNTAKKASYFVKNGDEINIFPTTGAYTGDLKPEKIPLDVIYEDDDVAVINKQRGLVVHPAPGNYTGTLVNALLHHFDKLSTINGSDNNTIRPGIVHRIDKDTSGLLIVAKNNFSHMELAKQLQDKKVLRLYQCIVHGIFPHDSATIDAPIGRGLKDRKKMIVIEKNSKNAVTHLKVLKRYDQFTHLECRLETGRTHQIRVHMKYIGFPIVGDPKYGTKKTPDIGGQLLHAGVIGFRHPRKNEYLEFKVDPPSAFLKFL